MYDKGRHDKHRQMNDESKYRLQGGMAKVALESRRRQEREGKTVTDAHGNPLYYSQRIADGGVSNSTLEKWMRKGGQGRSGKSYFVV